MEAHHASAGVIDVIGVIDVLQAGLMTFTSWYSS
jgi:hypothetical protein